VTSSSAFAEGLCKFGVQILRTQKASVIQLFVDGDPSVGKISVSVQLPLLSWNICKKWAQSCWY